MTTANYLVKYKRDVKIATAQEILALVGQEAESVSGNRLKHLGAMGCVQAVAKYLKKLQNN